jgi:hypothetical protein
MDSAVKKLQDRLSLTKLKAQLAPSTFKAILWTLGQTLIATAIIYPQFRMRLKERNLIAQIKARDENIGRWFEIRGGRVRSHHGLHKKPDITLGFKNAALGVELLTPPINWLNQVNAQKDFKLTVEGPEDLTNWFAQTLMMMQSVGYKMGVSMPDGSVRYCNMANGGPLFVYVKDGKIIRTTPIAFDDTDPQPWTIEARGQKFTPPRKTTLAPHGQNAKSIIYSPDRLLYPLKRVDFDPKGARNPQNRGKSGYVRISWDEALDIVANEIKRVKHDHGPGAMTVSHGSHHTWGHVGYYLSCLFRFRNAVGHTPVHHNPDSWEGWYWGAAHHWGYTLRVGQCETYGTVEDLLKNCEMVVFWAADPDTTSGSYGSQEGTVRRQWLKKLGIKLVHIDPYFNSSAQFLPGKWLCPKPTTSPALALAIAYVWIKEGLYDKEYVAAHTVGFDAWKAYVMGEEDGTPKTPEWQEKETGVPAKDVRALAREWAKHLSRLRRLGQRPWRRLPQPDRHPVGAHDGVSDCDAGIGQARHQYGEPAMGLPGRSQFLFPRLRRWRHVRRSRSDLACGRAVSAHAAAPDHEYAAAKDSAHLSPRGDP